MWTKIGALVTVGLVEGSLLCTATPSTQVWIPSADIQSFKTIHLGIDNYFRASSTGHFTPGQRDPNIYDLGLTAGVLPFEKVKMEVGADYLINGTSYDSFPFYFNAKVGVPEDAFCKYGPALAVGGMNFGTHRDKDSATRTDQNVVYGLIARTLPALGPVPSLGRLSAGYYIGNNKVLVDTDGSGAASGLLLSWDRTMSEISDNLWLAVDYMGGDNALGALSFGLSWAFSKNVSVIFGYDIYTEKALAGANTFTTQLDINFP